MIDKTMFTGFELRYANLVLHVIFCDCANHKFCCTIRA